MKFLESGILLINKPVNWTSSDVIRKIKSKNQFRKIGHAGTLDPLATGILPILLNDSTRYFNYFQNFKKSYLAEIKFGLSTSTYDLEGEVEETTDKIPDDLSSINEKIPKFLGSIKQIPPIYSAIKKNGKRLYDYARNNENIDLEPRTVNVSEIKIISWESPNLKLIIKCSSGFYVRSFAYDLAKSLNSLGVLVKLSRISYGPFVIKDASNLNNFEEIMKNLISTETIFDKNKKLIFDKDLEKEYYQGKVFSSENLSLNLLNNEEIKIYNLSNKFIGLLTFDNSKKFWKPKNIIK
ncbi:MAG: tRNA pseudouridine(55) synthase TruB [Chloroflexota bacterium]|nr:tRNA pseudouridine(55) synthase TruB [Chloroflexota bacterium]